MVVRGRVIELTDDGAIVEDADGVRWLVTLLGTEIEAETDPGDVAEA